VAAAGQEPTLTVCGFLSATDPLPPAAELRAQRQVHESSRHGLGLLSKYAYAFTIHAIWEAMHAKRTTVSIRQFQSFTEI